MNAKRSIRVVWLAVAVLLSAPVPAAEPTILAVGAGPVAAELADGMAERWPSLRVEREGGSREALERLVAGEADLALVQEDHLEWFGERAADPGFTVLARPFQRHLHVVVRRPLRLEGIQQLPDLRVWFGCDADSRRSLARLLDRVGVPWHAAAGEAACPAAVAADGGVCPLETLRRCLGAGELDVAAMMAVPGALRLEPVLRSGVAEAAPLDYRTIRLLETDDADTGVLMSADLPGVGATGHAGRSSLRTIAVPVVLVAPGAGGSGGPRDTPRAVAASLTDAWRAMAADYAAEAGVPDPGADDRLWGWLVVSLLVFTVVLAAAVLYLARSRRPAVRRLRQNLALLTLLLVVPSAIVAVTLVTYVAEHRFNEHFSSPAESFWSITVYLFSGLEDRTPYTPLGKTASAFGLLLGPVLFTLATGWVASRFIHWKRKMPKNLHDHYLLLNWNLRGLQAVRQIHDPLITRKEGTGVIVVLSDDLEVNRRLKDEGMGEDPYFEDLFISIGDPTYEQALLNANAQDAKTILILADERLGEHADEKTIRSLFALRRIARCDGRDGLHVVAELVNAANRTICDQVAEDFPGFLECVTGGETRAFLLAQAALRAGVVGFYRNLLTVSGDTNELYMLPIPPRAVGMGFGDYAARVLAARPESPILPVGVQRWHGGRPRTVCNPRPDEPGTVLEEGDRLIVLAYEPPAAGDLPEPG